MKLKVHFENSAHEAFLTTDHPASSYGIPVLVPGFALSHYMRASAYGPGDLVGEPPLVLCETPTTAELEAIHAAGFNLRHYEQGV